MSFLSKLLTWFFRLLSGTDFYDVRKARLLKCLWSLVLHFCVLHQSWDRLVKICKVEYLRFSHCLPAMLLEGGKLLWEHCFLVGIRELANQGTICIIMFPEGGLTVGNAVYIETLFPSQFSRRRATCPAVFFQRLANQERLLHAVAFFPSHFNEGGKLDQSRKRVQEVPI